MQQPKHTLRSSTMALTIMVAFVLLTISSCSKQVQGQPSQASAFRGEIYRSRDGRVVVTMTSSDELEVTRNGVNLICKYRRQATAIRAVATVMGTPQAVYYRIVPEGLRDPDGRILYSPKALATVTKQAELARRQAAEQARVLAEERAKEAQRLAAAAIAAEAERSRQVILRLRDNGDGTISDTKTGLMWMTNPVVNQRWSEAMATCKGSQLAGHRDWHMASRAEMETIITSDGGAFVDASDGRYFGKTIKTGEGGFLSSDSVDEDYGLIWVAYGNMPSRNWTKLGKWYNARALCVRSER